MHSTGQGGRSLRHPPSRLGEGAMKQCLGLSFVAVLLFVLTSAAASAQATAELNGRVTDESGAVLPGVTVTASQTDTGFTRSVVTDATGAYLMPNLPTGPYKLE